MKYDKSVYIIGGIIIILFLIGIINAENCRNTHLDWWCDNFENNPQSCYNGICCIKYGDVLNDDKCCPPNNPFYNPSGNYCVDVPIVRCENSEWVFATENYYYRNSIKCNAGNLMLGGNDGSNCPNNIFLNTKCENNINYKCSYSNFLLNWKDIGFCGSCQLMGQLCVNFEGFSSNCCNGLTCNNSICQNYSISNCNSLGEGCGSSFPSNPVCCEGLICDNGGCIPYINDTCSNGLIKCPDGTCRNYCNDTCLDNQVLCNGECKDTCENPEPNNNLMIIVIIFIIIGGGLYYLYKKKK